MELEKMKLGGAHLRAQDIEAGKVLSIAQKPKIEYAWDNGVAIGRYLEELKKGRIIGRKCNKCRRIMIPPRMFCEFCWRNTDEWVYVKDTGTVNTFSICYINWDASRIPKGKPPYIPAVIHIDGATPGMGILHKLGEVAPDDVRIGMKVKAVWKKPEEREGSILDILYWKPTGKPSKKSNKSNLNKKTPKMKA
ncbi:MAG: Zn-ribbon domain-containing OB-fold protein, partial [Actinomycetota bacterium]|nr:Zn-ribbon domain-containing OB-fold protein [Actinomycetota bacterium]